MNFHSSLRYFINIIEKRVRSSWISPIYAPMRFPKYLSTFIIFQYDGLAVNCFKASYIHQYMHQYSTQQLAKEIPRIVRSWSTDDVVKWLTLNQIEIDAELFHQKHLDGDSLLNIYPDQLMENFGLTKYISKQIVEWLEDESAEFDEYVLNGDQGDDSSSSNAQKVEEKQVLRIDDLQQNQTEKENKKEEINDVTERVAIGKWESKKLKNQLNSQMIPNNGSNNPKIKMYNVSPVKNPYVKFASSEFISINRGKILEKRLKIEGDSYSFIIGSNCRIGRFKDNLVCIAEDSVSRTHAEINCVSTSKGDIKYFIKDLKSKFGTFIGCRSAQTNIEGCSFLLEDTQIQILNIETHKPSPTNRQRTFDITIKIEEKQIKLANKSSVVISNKKNADIKCDQGTAKIWLDKDKKICCLEVVQGKLFKKLKQFQQWDIEAHMEESTKKVQFCFGTFKCTIESIQFCVECNKVSNLCEC